MLQVDYATFLRDVEQYRTASQSRHYDTGPHTPYGWLKILLACNIAMELGLEYIWIDTCCIDKSSSAELSEAINSMYKWYEASFCCYVFLHDVPSSSSRDLLPADESGLDQYYDRHSFNQRNLRESEWFTRGWSELPTSSTYRDTTTPSCLLFHG